MSRETENTVLLLVGISVAMIVWSGAFTRYVKPGLLPWLVASAVLLVAFALFVIVGDIRRGGPRVTDRADDHGDEHSHRAGIAWLLVIPILVLCFVAPPALRSSAAAPSVTSVSNDVLNRAFPPLPPGRAPEVSLPDVLMREAHDTTGSLTNRPITMTGFVLNEAHGVDLGRIVIICCAADAQLARIHVGGPAADQAAGLPDNTWLRVEGKVIPAQPNSGATPTLQATTVARIDAPANPYAYPH
ncbi:TIGR03943 family protein [Mycobacterium heidelbergense]|uniref:TIGR03943 family protein n=1 Tax=Mycobacterium heidelbergense TaxID=53376 RepID=A0A1X0DVX0_MYCHE|nr:TIGR03943 family protein [Mycobacterium heidelbergense]MCV7053000.1 TIGR03943 family protein [Mycobacterium heidelbergense]ORA76362.1 TIGR03943 family protein [Mycobacterium heidelbergense]BBZ50838.1 TIGR03943 family protein [Mycobacterium heidelbergense]